MLIAFNVLSQRAFMYLLQKTLGTRSNDAPAFSLGSSLFYGPVIN